MKRLSSILCLLCLLLTGCVFISLPKEVPLEEKTLGGRGADKILVIDLSGIITEDGGRGRWLFGQKPGRLALLKEELDLAAKDTDIKAVILRINSPGGAVTVCDIMNHEMALFKKKRNLPVIAEFMDIAASGGYYIAAASDKIVAHPTTVTGSIGVIAYNLNASGLLDKIGISDQTIKSGNKKDIGSPLRPMTEEDRRIMQSIIDEMYERFLTVITGGRPELAKLDRAELKKIADGRIYTAEQALKLKLIDRIGYMDDAIELAKEAAGVKEARVIAYSSPRAYKNNIYSMAETLDAGAAPQVNLVNIDGSLLSERLGMRFMYLWAP
ncbi:MAG: signal peptide peptidase SppA [Deltaproteobacteria bacterium]|nr:signal peptide peptidase SppA [Deltaproteobacteria bacterium]